MLQHPFELCTAEICVNNQTRFFTDHLRSAVALQLFAKLRRAATLPNDRRADRLARLAFPKDGRLALIRDADGRDVCSIHAAFADDLLQHGKLRVPNLVGVVLDPAVLRIILRKFPLRHGGHITETVE